MARTTGLTPRAAPATPNLQGPAPDLGDGKWYRTVRVPGQTYLILRDIQEDLIAKSKETEDIPGHYSLSQVIHYAAVAYKKGRALKR